MKKITFLLMCFLSMLGYSQVVLEDLEGSAPSTQFFDDNGGGQINVISNPDTMNAVNTSANALEIITNASGNAWQGAELILQGDLMDLSSNTTVQIDVYSTTATDILAKVVAGGGGTGADSATDASHTGSGWETLSFDFSAARDNTAAANGTYQNIIFYPLWNNLGGTCTTGCYSPYGTPGVSAMETIVVDNITAVAAAPAETCNDGIQNQDETGIDCGGSSCPPCAVAPTTAAPTPPARPAADVISIYSDAYTDIGVDTYDTPWCPGTTTEVMIDGNATQLLTGASCDGIDWQSSRTVDASTFTHFHIDFYTDDPDVTTDVLNMKFSQWGGTSGEVSALEFNVNNGTTPGLATGTWVSVDIDLTAMPINPLVGGLLDRDDIVQFVFTTSMNNVWWDNLYLHKNTVLSTDEFEAAELRVFPNPTSSDWTISSSSEISSINVYDILGKQVASLTPNNSEARISTLSLKSGIYFARVEGVNGSQTVKLVKE